MWTELEVKVIRLAHASPKLRPELVPLLRQSALRKLASKGGKSLGKSLLELARLAQSYPENTDWSPELTRHVKEVGEKISRGDKKGVSQMLPKLAKYPEFSSLYNEVSNWVEWGKAASSRRDQEWKAANERAYMKALRMFQSEWPKAKTKSDLASLRATSNELIEVEKRLGSGDAVPKHLRMLVDEAFALVRNGFDVGGAIKVVSEMDDSLTQAILSGKMSR